MPEFNDWFPGSIYGTSHVNVKAFGAIGDGNQNLLSTLYPGNLAAAQVDYPKATALTDSADWCAIQAAIDYAIENDIYTVLVPDGHYYVTDTIHLGYGWIGGTANLTSVMLLGAGFGPISVGFGHLAPGTWIFSLFLDRPVINIQGGRKSGVRHISIQSTTLPTSAEGQAINWRANKANYIPAGAQNTQYTPFCGVCIDGYSGTPAPASPYPTPRYHAYAGTPASAYGAALSSEWFVEECRILGTNVGIMCHPYGGGNGDFGKVRGCLLEYLKIAVCVADSQARSMDFQNCNVFSAHTFIDARSHGIGIGNIQGNFTNIHFGHVWRCIHGMGSWSHAVHFESLYAEVAGVLGDWAGGIISFESLQWDSADTILSGSTITEWRQEPMLKITNGTAEFRNCNFEYRTIYHFEGRCTFHNCTFNATGTATLANLPAGMAKAIPAFGRVFITGPHVETMLPSPFSGRNGSTSRMSDGSAPNTWNSYGYNNSTGQNLWSRGQSDDNYCYDYDFFPMARYWIINGTWGSLSGITRTVDSYDLTNRHEIGDVIWSQDYALYAVESIDGDGHTLTVKALTHFKMESGTYSMLSLYGEESAIGGAAAVDYSSTGNLHWFPIGTLDLVSYTASANGIFMKTTVASPTISFVDCDDVAVTTPATIAATSKPLFMGLDAKKRGNTQPFPKWTFITTIGANTLTMNQNALVSGTWAYGPGIKKLK